jgi:hypothetical protein
MAQLILARKCLIFRTKGDQTELENTGPIGNKHRRHAADLGADMFPAPAVFALDAEQFFGEFASRRR